MSVSQITPSRKFIKAKRNSMTRPQSTVEDIYSNLRGDFENENVTPAFKIRLHSLFRQIEKEFELLYQENQNLQEKIEILNEKIESQADKQNCDSVDFDSSVSKVLAKKVSSSSSQKLKTAYKLKAQTSKIVSSFKAPNLTCNVVKEYSGHKDGVWEVSVSRTGQPIIATASADHSACIWSIDNARCLLQYNGHNGSVNSVRFHPQKDLMLTASGDSTAHIWHAVVSWDLPKGYSSEEELEGSEDCDENKSDAKVATLRTPICELLGHTGPVSSADWLAGGDHVITASWDRTGMLHDIEAHTTITTLTGHDLELTHAATHPSQKLAVTSSRDTTFRLWDFRETVQSVSVFQGHSESVTSAVFAKEDKVVSGSDDRTVKVWDLRNMRSPLATIRTDSAINRISVSSAGVIAIPHDNRQVRLFDLTGQRLARLPRSNRQSGQGHSRMVASTAWADEPSTNNNINLFTCGFDRKVFGWSVQLVKDKEKDI